MGRVYRVVAISKNGDLQEQGVVSTLLSESSCRLGPAS